MRAANENPGISVEAQYIKDFSFENPGSPATLRGDHKPAIEMALDLRVARLEKEKDIFEVVLSIQANAVSNEESLFVVELVYAGVFSLYNMEDEERRFVLGVHCPMLLFPFARQVIANITQAGGFQPLMIDPIDFSALYASKMNEEGGEDDTEE